LLTASFISANSGNIGLIPALNDFTLAPIVSINKMHTSGYWTLTASSGITGGTYTVSATCTNMPGINSISGLRLLRRNNSASAWSLAGISLAASGSLSAPVIARSGLSTSGGEFGLGSDSSINPLPVKWLNVKARWEGSDARLLWSTSSEVNNSHFEIEQSLDNSTFRNLGTVKGMGTTFSTQQYSYTDYSPLTNDNRQIYYRIKQVDFDGKYVYSKTVSVISNEEDNSVRFVIFPNPTSGQLRLSNTSNKLISYSIYSMHGELISLGNSVEPHSTLLCKEELDGGVYWVMITSERQQKPFRLVVIK
jgi:hypothetical protein